MTTLPGAELLQNALPPNFSAAIVFADDREKRIHRIVNQYGVPMFVLHEGEMFESAVEAVCQTSFPNAHRLTDNSYQNVIIFVEGILEINTAVGDYMTTIRLLLLTADGDEIGRMEMDGESSSLLINDETAVYNAYVDAVHSAIQKFFRSNPSYVRKMAALKKSRLPRKESQGTGFFLNQFGAVLTNYHVVEECGEVLVETGGGSYGAKPAAADKVNDLAVIQIDYSSTRYALFDENEPIMGRQVTVFGYGARNLDPKQERLYPSLTTGVVSYLGDIAAIQISASIQPGNSGSPVISDDGRVVGIVAATADPLNYATRTGTLPQNVNIAVRTSVIRSFLGRNQIPYSSSDATDSDTFTNPDEPTTASSAAETKKSTADIAKESNEYVVAVRCLAP